MTAEPHEARQQPARKWHLWLIFAAAVVLLGIAITLVQHMPGAKRLPDGAELAAPSGQALALYNLRAAPVLQLDGATGAGLRVGVSTARLAPATRRKLFLLGVALPNVRGAPTEWQGRAPANGSIAVTIGNQRQSPDGGVFLEAAGSGDAPQLNLRAVQTVLTAAIAIAPHGAAIATVPQLKFGEASFSDPVLAAMVVEIEIPPGETMSLAFDSREDLAGTLVRPAAGKLGLGRAEVGQPSASNSYPRLVSSSEGICAARAGKALLMRREPGADDCRLGKDRGTDRLAATAFALAPDTVAVTLAGSGFVSSGGTAKRVSLVPALVANPLIGVVVVVLVGAIGWPLWRLWKGRRS